MLRSLAIPPPSSLPIIPEGFCQCGCGQRTTIAKRTYSKKGIIAGKFLRFAYGHHGIASVDCILNLKTGCWDWQRGKNHYGYGIVRINGSRCRMAHTVYWEAVNGPIPENLVLDHLCLNHACVNPAHLEPVTQAENNRRAICSYGWETARKVRELWESGNYRQTEIARLLGLKTNTVWCIVNHHTWKGNG